MALFRLPVSGLDVLFRQTTGAEDILLIEEPAPDIHLALKLADALGRLPNGEAVPWNSLPVPDLDAALLALRRQFIGEQISTSVVCSDRAAGCRTRIDIAFRIGDYLEHHAPAGLPRGVSPAAEPGWFQLDGTDVTGRLATC